MANVISIATLFDLLKTKVGWQNPHHKYIYRIPLPGGGYKYVYHTGVTKNFSSEDAAEHDKDPDFVSEQDKAVEEFINFAANPVAVKKHVVDIEKNFNSVYGPMWEIISITISLPVTRWMKLLPGIAILPARRPCMVNGHTGTGKARNITIRKPN